MHLQLFSPLNQGRSGISKPLTVGTFVSIVSHDHTNFTTTTPPAATLHAESLPSDHISINRSDQCLFFDYPLILIFILTYIPWISICINNKIQGDILECIAKPPHVSPLLHHFVYLYLCQVTEP